MKKTLLYLFTITSILSFAQEEASWWVFGDNASIEFTPNPQNRSNEAFISGITFEQEEGVGTISDDNGNLLFFTDGQNVFNRNGNTMPNGTGLLGGESATQASVIVKAPETPGVYFIFTVGNSGNGPLAYSRIDMQLNGGLGDIVPGVKNVILMLECQEKIGATIKTDSNNAYVMTMARSNGTSTSPGSGPFNALFAWEVNGISGSNVSFVSSTPVPQSGNGNAPGYDITSAQTNGFRGTLRTSPDGTKVVVGHHVSDDDINSGITGFQNGAWLFDFNPSNGQFGGTGVRLDNGPVYGVEFSATSQYLYYDISSDYFPGPTSNKKIVQYDLCDPTNILSTRNEFVDLDTESRGSLQLAKDGNIYVTRYEESFLGRIENSESDNPIYNPTAVDISPGISRQGLPVFVQSSFQSFFTVNNQCQGDTTEFILACLPQVAQSNWDFGDGNTLTVSGSDVVTNTYTTAGTYTVTVNVTTVSGDIRDFSQDIIIFENGIVGSIDDQTLLNYCDGNASGNEIIDLTQFTADILDNQDAATFNVTYYANSVDASAGINQLPNNYNVTLGTTTIWVQISNNTATIDNNCSAIGSFDITLSPVPTAANIPNSEFCDNNGVGIGDLDAFLPTIIAQTNSNSFNIDYTIHESQIDADMNRNPIDTTIPYQNTGNFQTLYVRLQNTNDTDCFSTASFDIVSLPAPNPGTPTDIEECTSSNQNTFDLSVQNTDILNGLTPADYTITYHTTNEDAQNDTNAIPVNYVVPLQTNESSTLLFARLENNNTGCFNTTQFTVISRRCEIIFPEGFSPNNDQVNDTLSIPGLTDQYDNFELNIFNRYGSLIYKTRASNYEEFAGIPNTGLLFGDNLVPPGTYFYMIKYNDPDQEDTVKWFYINY